MYWIRRTRRMDTGINVIYFACPLEIIFHIVSLFIIPDGKFDTTSRSGTGKDFLDRP